MHVVDTDVCIDALRGVPRAVDALEALEAEGRLAVSAVTAHELREGAARSHDPIATSAAVETFLRAFDVLAYDDVAAREGGRIAGELATAGRAIGDLDTMIAATAVSVGAALVTRNGRHFRRVRGLGVRTI